MRRFPSDPVRLADLGPQDDPGNLARLVQSAIAAPTEPIPVLKGRIRCSLRRKPASRRRHLRVAILGGVVFLSGGVLGAVTQPIFRLWQEHGDKPPASKEAVARAARPQHRKLPVQPGRGLAEPAPVPPELAAAPAPEPEPARSELPAPPAPAAAAALPPPRGRVQPSKPTLALAETTPRRVSGLDPLPWPSLPPPPSAASSTPAPAASSQRTLASASSAPSPSSPAAMATTPPVFGNAFPPVIPAAPAPAANEPVAAPPLSEQALLSRAVRGLRFEHRPEAALAALDEYSRRFPRGSLSPEAGRLRAEALLALGQKGAALAELDQAGDTGAPGDEERLLARGELHAAAGRWREAMRDFDLVVRGRLAHAAESAGTSKLRERFERALWDRASARGHLGDEAGARADLRECLRRFPAGRFAAQVTELLRERR